MVTGDVIVHTACCTAISLSTTTQVVLSVWHNHCPQPCGHVCSVFEGAGGHYRGDSKAGIHPVVQAVWPLPPAPQTLAQGRTREQGAVDILHQACAWPQQGGEEEDG